MKLSSATFVFIFLMELKTDIETLETNAKTDNEYEADTDKKQMITRIKNHLIYAEKPDQLK
jgi:hypothetical protein